MPRDRAGDDADAPSLLQQLAGVDNAEIREESRMTGNASDPFAESPDPDRTVFDPESVFGADDQADGDSSTEGGDATSSLWGALPGEVSGDHTTQVLQSDPFGRPFSESASGDSAGADPWGPSPFGGSTTEEPRAQSDPSAHIEHEVPPPWEVESGGGPGGQQLSWQSPSPEQPWQPGGAEPPTWHPGGDEQSWQASPGNGQPGWHPPEFDPFGHQQHDAGPWAPDVGSPAVPDFDPFTPTHGSAHDVSAFGQAAPFSGPAQDQGTPAAEPVYPQPPDPFGPTDSAPSPFEAAPVQDAPGGPAAGHPPGPPAPDAPAESPDLSPFWQPPAAGEPSQYDPPHAPEQRQPYQPAAGDEDAHTTESLRRPDDPGQFAQPWQQPGPGQQAEQPPAPWGAWPGDAVPPQAPPRQQPQRYDLSQFQHGYQPPGQQPHQAPQPPHQPPQPPQQAPQPQQQAPQPQQPHGVMPGQAPPQGPGFGGFQQPMQDPYTQQFPGMAAPTQMPPQQPIPLTSESLAPQELLRPRKAPPTSGWRRAVFKASGGLLDPGESGKEIQRQQMETLVRTPVAGGHYRVAVLSLKGGVGKTTTTVGLGATLATLRGDRIIAVDANPDRGTLSEKVRLETRANVRDMLANRGAIQRYSDVRQYTSQSASRLEVLASDPDPAISEAFSENDYRAIADVLEHYYSICLTDCGTGLLHSAMSGVLGLADQIVLVSSASVDGARSASATLDWLDAHDYGDLVRTGVVVMSAVRPQNKAVDLSRLEQHFSARCRALVRIPFDPHLEAGAEFVLDQLNAPTGEAYLELTAAVAAGFQHRLPR